MNEMSKSCDARESYERFEQTLLGSLAEGVTPFTSLRQHLKPVVSNHNDMHSISVLT